jgi:hypothetical protein
VGALRVHGPEAVTADLRVMVCAEAAVVRIGPEAGAVVRGGAYRRFVQQLAAALGRAGVPAAAVLESRHLHPAALEELVPDAAGFVVSPDWDASITRLVDLRQASPPRRRRPPWRRSAGASVSRDGAR